jgi:hypothetical protein
MGNIARKARAEKTTQILSLWLGCEFQFLSRAFIKDELEKGSKHWSGKTVGRYLDRLVKENKFESEGGSRSKLYKPKQEYWDNTMQMIPINTNINEAEYLLFRDLAGKITATFNEAQSLGFQDNFESRDLIRGGGLRTADYNELNTLRRKLSRDIKTSLSKDYFDQDMESKDRYELLGDSIIRVVNDYMKLWAFIQKTNGARETFSGKFKRRIG